jgi:TonB family protein
LAPPEQPANKAETAVRDFASSPEQTAGAIAESDSAYSAEFVLNSPTQTPAPPSPKFAARNAVIADEKPPEQEQVFSILPAPVTSPDSINIDAVYVSNESISLHQQASAASLTELYADTAAVQSAPLQMSRVVTIEKMPQPLRIEVPEYPVWAKKRGISGTVWIKARVTSDGKISDALVLSCDSKGAGFEESALAAAKNNLFVPASSNGINLSVWVVYPVKFINKN